MPAYLVRLIANKDLVGFYYADEIDELCEFVDECIDVSKCEYAELSAGGIFWPGRAVAIPIHETDDSGEPSIPWSAATLTESWIPALYADGEVWLPLEAN